MLKANRIKNFVFVKPKTEWMMEDVNAGLEELKTQLNCVHIGQNMLFTCFSHEKQKRKEK